MSTEPGRTDRTGVGGGHLGGGAMEGMSRLRRRCAVGCLMVAMVAAGCGNRSDKDDAAARVVPGSAAVAPSPLAPNDEPASSAPAVDGALVPGGNAGTAAAASPAPAGTPAAGATGKPATAPSGSR